MQQRRPSDRRRRHCRRQQRQRQRRQQWLQHAARGTQWRLGPARVPGDLTLCAAAAAKPGRAGRIAWLSRSAAQQLSTPQQSREGHVHRVSRGRSWAPGAAMVGEQAELGVLGSKKNRRRPTHPGALTFASLRLCLSASLCLCVSAPLPRAGRGPPLSPRHDTGTGHAGRWALSARWRDGGTVRERESRAGAAGAAGAGPPGLGWSPAAVPACLPPSLPPRRSRRSRQSQ